MSRSVLGSDPFADLAAERQAARPAGQPPAAPVADAGDEAPRDQEPCAALDEFEAAMDRRLEDMEARARALEPDGGEERSGRLRVVTRALSGLARELLHPELARLPAGRELVEVDRFGLDPRLEARAGAFLDLLYDHYWRVETRGIEQIPALGRAILVANRGGFLPWDSLILKHAVQQEHPTGREVRPLVEDDLFHFPYLGTLINRLGGVRACPENATMLLEEEQLVAVFPEGIKGASKPWGSRYRLQRFGRGGVVKLAIATGSPLVPVAIAGAEEAYPMLARTSYLVDQIGLPFLPLTPTFPHLGPLGLLPLPSKWIIRFGAPVDLPDDPEILADPARIHQHTEELRQTIQGLLQEALAQRGHPYLGRGA